MACSESRQNFAHKLFAAWVCPKRNWWTCRKKYAIFPGFFHGRASLFCFDRNSAWCCGCSDSGIYAFHQGLRPKIPIHFFGGARRGEEFELFNIFLGKSLILDLIARSSRTMARSNFFLVDHFWNNFLMTATLLRTRTNTFYPKYCMRI